jgi:hypothetical protein
LYSPHLAIDRLERVLSVVESFGLSLFLDFWKGDNKRLQALLADAPGAPVFLDTPTWGNNPRSWLKTKPATARLLFF